MMRLRFSLVCFLCLLLGSCGGGQSGTTSVLPFTPAYESYISGSFLLPNGCTPYNSNICRTCISFTAIFNFNSNIQQTITNDDGTVSVGPVVFILEALKFNLARAEKAIYQSMSQNSDFQRAVKACMVMVILFYFIGVLLGASSAKPLDMVLMVVKIALVGALVIEAGGSTGYEFFATLVKNTIESTINSLSVIMYDTFGNQPDTNAPLQAGQEANIFRPLEEMLGMFFTINFAKFMFALMSGKFLDFALLSMGIYIYLSAIIWVMYVYIIALVGRTFLYAMAPAFMVFLMFKTISKRGVSVLFDNWMKQLINFSLQPILLFSLIGIFAIILRGFLSYLVDDPAYSVCFMEIGGNQTANVKFYSWKLSRDMGLTSLRPEDNFGLNFTSLLAFVMFGMLLKGFISWITEISAHISGGLMTIGGAAPAAWSSLVQSLTSPLNAAAGGLHGLIAGTTDSMGRPVGPGLAGMSQGFMNRWEKDEAGKTRSRALLDNLFGN